MSEELKRGPGRPPKTEEPKKGKRSWTPSNLGDIIDKESGFRYRRVRKDDENISKKLEEGWEFVNGVTDPRSRALHPESRPDEPHKLTSNLEGRDWVAMRLPEETAELRDQYVNAKTKRTEESLKSQAGRELAKDKTTVHGTITKESKGIVTTYE